MTRKVFYIDLAWLVLLFLPALTVFSSWSDWGQNPWLFFAITLCLLIPARLLLHRHFFWVSWPFVFFGVACAVADFVVGVDLLELSLNAKSFSIGNIMDALSPYCWWLLGWLSGSLFGAYQGYINCQGKISRQFSLPLLLLVALVLSSVSPMLWANAWPLNAVIPATLRFHDSPLLLSALHEKYRPDGVRDTHRSWDAHQTVQTTENQTFVLLIGESVRGDYFNACGSPFSGSKLRHGAVVACDVSASSNSTHSSVPLLISRDLPGSIARIPPDGTFLKAFKEAGFKTYWLAVQPEPVAWPEADVKFFAKTSGLDYELLLPELKKVLADGEPKRLIVLHAENAHSSYCNKFKLDTAPNPVDCSAMNDDPSSANIANWRAAYANAVDESVNFLNLVIAQLDTLPGQAYAMYSSDHGENLLDDQRQLYYHALRHPSVWDVGVQIVFWANGSWKSSHATKWQQIKENLDQPLMHADVVPTLLGAADITYADTRQGVFDLTAKPVMPRTRWVQESIGKAIDWQQLAAEVTPASLLAKRAERFAEGSRSR